MPATSVSADFAAARAAVPVVAERVAALVDGMREPDRPSPCAQWSVQEVAVHLSNAFLAYSSAAEGKLGEWTELIPGAPDLLSRLTELNTRALSYVGPDDRVRLGELMVERAGVLVEACEGRAADEIVETPWLGEGASIPLSAVCGLLLSESLLHGLDIARGSGRTWRISPEHARLVLSLVFPVIMPMVVDRAVARGKTAAVHVHVRGGVVIRVEVDDGEVSVSRDPEGRAADCHLTAHPVAFLLLASGRATMARLAFTGRFLVYGRKPWLGPVVQKLFIFP